MLILLLLFVAASARAASVCPQSCDYASIPAALAASETRLDVSGRSTIGRAQLPLQITNANTEIRGVDSTALIVIDYTTDPPPDDPAGAVIVFDVRADGFRLQNVRLGRLGPALVSQQIDVLLSRNLSDVLISDVDFSRSMGTIHVALTASRYRHVHIDRCRFGESSIAHASVVVSAAALVTEDDHNRVFRSAIYKFSGPSAFLTRDNYWPLDPEGIGAQHDTYCLDAECARLAPFVSSRNPNLSFASLNEACARHDDSDHSPDSVLLTATKAYVDSTATCLNDFTLDGHHNTLMVRTATALSLSASSQIRNLRVVMRRVDSVFIRSTAPLSLRGVSILSDNSGTTGVDADRDLSVENCLFVRLQNALRTRYGDGNLVVRDSFFLDGETGVLAPSREGGSNQRLVGNVFSRIAVDSSSQTISRECNAVANDESSLRTAVGDSAEFLLFGNGLDVRASVVGGHDETLIVASVIELPQSCYHPDVDGVSLVRSPLIRVVSDGPDVRAVVWMRSAAPCDDSHLFNLQSLDRPQGWDAPFFTEEHADCVFHGTGQMIVVADVPHVVGFVGPASWTEAPQLTSSPPPVDMQMIVLTGDPPAPLDVTPEVIILTDAPLSAQVNVCVICDGGDGTECPPDSARVSSLQSLPTLQVGATITVTGTCDACNLQISVANALIRGVGAATIRQSCTASPLLSGQGLRLDGLLLIAGDGDSGCLVDGVRSVTNTQFRGGFDVALCLGSADADVSESLFSEGHTAIRIETDCSSSASIVVRRNQFRSLDYCYDVLSGSSAVAQFESNILQSCRVRLDGHASVHSEAWTDVVAQTGERDACGNGAISILSSVLDGATTVRHLGAVLLTITDSVLGSANMLTAPNAQTSCVGKERGTAALDISNTRVVDGRAVYGQLQSAADYIDFATAEVRTCEGGAAFLRTDTECECQSSPPVQLAETSQPISRVFLNGLAGLLSIRSSPTPTPSPPSEVDEVVDSSPIGIVLAIVALVLLACAIVAICICIIFAERMSAPAAASTPSAAATPTETIVAQSRYQRRIRLADDGVTVTTDDSDEMPAPAKLRQRHPPLVEFDQLDI